MDKVANRSINNQRGVTYALIKGSIIALLVSMIGILLFALFLKFIAISDSAISWINQVIKALSILLGVRATLKISAGRGMIKGVLLGILYTFVAYLVFSFLSSSISFDTSTIIDFVFGGIMGGICGIIMNNSPNNL